MPKFNNIDLKDWKNSKVWTDSLWIIPERDKSGKHSGSYHGNFVPQIPHQMILRYTKKNDVVLDPFCGSGTTAFEAESLKRNFIGIDIQEKLIKETQSRLDNNDTFFELFQADSVKKETFKKIQLLLEQHNRATYQLAILHPPYHNIISFSDHPKDLSNIQDLDIFLEKFKQVVTNTVTLLQKYRYLAIIIGDKYTKGQWIPLGYYCMNEALKTGLNLKSVIVKNIEGNRAKNNKRAIWRYRALSSDYYIFKHEYIFVFKKEF